MRLRTSFLFALVLATPFTVLACESESGNQTPNIDASSPTIDGGTSPDGGGQVGQDGGQDTGTTTPKGDANALCKKYGTDNLLAFGATGHPQTNFPDANAAPPPTGGAIVDGVYDSIKNENYGNGTGSSGGNDKSLLVLENGAWFYRYAFGGVDDLNFSAGVYSLNEATKEIDFGAAVCGGGGVPGDKQNYSATPTTFATHLSQLVGPTNTPVVKVRTFQKR